VKFDRPAIESRLLSLFGSNRSRIPILLGGCGSGRTTLLNRMTENLGDGNSQYIDAERAASTPEGFYAAIMAHSPYVPTDVVTDVCTASESFDALLRFFKKARSKNGEIPAFLIDEMHEIRTFESFPGLRGVLDEFLTVIGESQNRFILSSRYVNRAHQFLKHSADRFEVIHVPPLSPSEVSTTLMAFGVGRDDSERIELGRIMQALTCGRPAYVQALTRELARMDGVGSGDPISALAAQLAPGAPLSQLCRFSYELRLHRARGYGALKAILQILADEEPLTLTEIAQRLGRTAGSTKDYLSWLLDVDLINVRQKRYSYDDQVLRLWVRLHCRPVLPDVLDLAREVQEYAIARIPFLEEEHELVDSPSTPDETKESETFNLIEID
jgi:hypothetical protein